MDNKGWKTSFYRSNLPKKSICNYLDVAHIFTYSNKMVLPLTIPPITLFHWRKVLTNN